MAHITELEEQRGLSLFTSHVQAAVAQERSRLDQLQAYQQQIHNTISQLEELPKKLQHKICVPFGRHAFFPGQLENTNEYRVHLGAGYYVHCTAFEARQILQRRLERVEKLIRSVQATLDEKASRLQAFQTALVPGVSEDGERFLDIKESYEDSQTLLASAAAKPHQPDTSPARDVTGAPRVAGVSQAVGTAAAAAQPAQQLQQQTGTVGSTQRQGGGDAEMDALFARIEELERLEAEAGSQSSDDEAAEPVAGSAAGRAGGGGSQAGGGGSVAQRVAVMGGAQATGQGSQQRAVGGGLPEQELEWDSGDSDDEEDWAGAFMPVRLSGSGAAGAAGMPQPAAAAAASPIEEAGAAGVRPTVQQAAQQHKASGVTSGKAGTARAPVPAPVSAAVGATAAAAGPAAATAPSGPAGGQTASTRAAEKPAFKKGFLLSSKPAASTRTQQQAQSPASSTSSHTTSRPNNSTATSSSSSQQTSIQPAPVSSAAVNAGQAAARTASQPPQPPSVRDAEQDANLAARRKEAFTGMVVERPTQQPPQPPAASRSHVVQDLVVERPQSDTTPVAGNAAASRSGKDAADDMGPVQAPPQRVSKFKMSRQRLG